MSLIRFGNLTVQQFADKVGADFTADEIAALESQRTDHAEFTDPAKFHIFDDPAVCIVIGTEAERDALPVFCAADGRRSFNRQVSFYPRRTTS